MCASLKQPPLRPSIRVVIDQDATKSEQRVVWNRRWLYLRALQADDAIRYAAFLASLDRARIDRRTLELLPDPTELGRSAPRNDDQDITFAAIDDDGVGCVLGIARAVRGPGSQLAEFGMVLWPKVEGQGLGRLLIGKLVNGCRDWRVGELIGQTSANNRSMIELARAFRFVVTPFGAPGIVLLRLRLREHAPG